MRFSTAFIAACVTAAFAAPVEELGSRALPTPVSAATARTYLASRTLIPLQLGSHNTQAVTVVYSESRGGEQLACVQPGLVQPLDLL